MEALYGRSVARWWDVVAGIRHDFAPDDAQSSIAMGVQGLAPQWFEIEATTYLGKGGQTAARLEVEYELLLTDRLILQPQVEASFFGKSDPARSIGSGLSTVEAGLRLRYEITRRFAPFVGIVHERAFGGTVDLRRARPKTPGTPVWSRASACGSDQESIVMTSGFKSALLLSIGFAVVVGVGITGFVWSGIYDVAADDPHTRPVHALLETVRDRSIERRVRRLAVPADLDDSARVVQGSGNYDAMCAGCHLVPGVNRTELSVGLYPQPPDLTRFGVDPARAFWVIKHGIKATGMPAWGGSMEDEYIWNMAAFLQRLPELDADAYRDMVDRSDGHSHGGGESGGHHHHSGGGHSEGEGADGHGHARTASDDAHVHADDARHVHGAPAPDTILEASDESPQTGHEEHEHRH